jgi:AraC-like DNA-binding protein
MQRHLESYTIPTLNPADFRAVMMEQYDYLRTDGLNFNDFYIHNLADNFYKLKLPLPHHRKTVHDFILLTRGKMGRSIGAEVFETEANNIFILSAGSITATHKISPDIQGYYCHFAPSFLALQPLSTPIQLLFDSVTVHHQPVLTIPPNMMPTLLLLLQRIEHYSAMLNSMPLYTSILKGYLITFLLEIRTCAEAITNFPIKTSLTASEVLTRQFRQLVSKHVHSLHSVQDYAQMLHISPNHLNKVVKKVTGITASSLLAELILLEAKVFLTQSHLSVADVGCSVGFEDAAYFGRFFRKRTGYTPSEFRKMIFHND